MVCSTEYSQSTFLSFLFHYFGQVQFLSAVFIELSDVESETEKYYNVEPYMAGDFRKITNNLNWTEEDGTERKDFLLAFSHFSYCESNENLIVVDIQGWTSQEKKGVTFLTDPQIHKRDKDGKGPRIQGKDAFQEFWKAIHPSCNEICKLLSLKRP